MSINISNYRFNGPYSSTDDLENRVVRFNVYIV